MSALAEPQRITFSANGISVAALSWGSDSQDAPLALCLHGYPDTAWTWRFLGPHLAANGWRVVAPFLRGYAPTELAPDNCYQVGALVRDIVDTHAALGGDERAVLIGHDWGGVAAYPTAAHSPELFRRVVTLAVPPLPVVFDPLTSPVRLARNFPLVARQLRNSWYTIFQQLPGISERSLGWLIPKLWRDWSPGYDGREDVARVFEALPDRKHRTAALRYYRALAQPWYRRSAYAAEQAHLFGIPICPTLFLNGRNDGCLQSAYAERSVGVLPEGSEVEIIENAGHFLQLEQPEVVNERISRFLAA